MRLISPRSTITIGMMADPEKLTAKYFALEELATEATSLRFKLLRKHAEPGGPGARWAVRAIRPSYWIHFPKGTPLSDALSDAADSADRSNALFESATDEWANAALAEHALESIQITQSDLEGLTRVHAMRADYLTDLRPFVSPSPRAVALLILGGIALLARTVPESAITLIGLDYARFQLWLFLILLVLLALAVGTTFLWRRRLTRIACPHREDAHRLSSILLSYFSIILQETEDRREAQGNPVSKPPTLGHG
jgi:hypothetical protein